MMQTELLTKRTVSSIGEEISHELGAKFISDFRTANPADGQPYVIGKDIISRILAQPGCAGIAFYNAINEKGEKTLVYLGLDGNGQEIVEYSEVNSFGVLQTEKAIVADRAGRGPNTTPYGGGGSWWEND